MTTIDVWVFMGSEDPDKETKVYLATPDRSNAEDAMSDETFDFPHGNWSIVKGQLIIA